MNDKTKIILILGIVIVLYFAIDQILKAIGIKKTTEDIKREKAVESITTSKFFDPLFFRGKAFASLGEPVTKEYAGYLRKAMRFAGTDEDAIFSTFGKLKCKYNISEIAEAYKLEYQRDLNTDLLNELSEKDIQKLYSIISNLPEK